MLSIKARFYLIMICLITPFLSFPNKIKEKISITPVAARYHLTKYFLDALLKSEKNPFELVRKMKNKLYNDNVLTKTLEYKPNKEVIKSFLCDQGIIFIKAYQECLKKSISREKAFLLTPWIENINLWFLFYLCFSLNCPTFSVEWPSFLYMCFISVFAITEKKNKNLKPLINKIKAKITVNEIITVILSDKKLPQEKPYVPTKKEARYFKSVYNRLSF